MNGCDRPFRHWVMDGFLSPSVVRRINEKWPDHGWRKEDGKAQRKWSQPIVDGEARRVWERLAGVEFCQALGSITGIPGLFTDEDQFGGGLHSVPPGGFLGIHTDFQFLPNGDRRRLNLLVYLNEEWHEKWGGYLELRGDSMKKIAPKAGRAVLFETTKKTWHGHPEPTRAPIHRRSIALYYYTLDNGEHDKTVYR